MARRANEHRQRRENEHRQRRENDADRAAIRALAFEMDAMEAADAERAQVSGKL